MLELFSDFIEKIEHPAMFFDNAGAMLYANKAAKRFFSIPKNYKDISVNNIFSVKYFSLSINALRELINKKSFVIRTVYTDPKKGEKIPVEIESMSLQRKAGRRIAGRALILRDVSIFQSLIDSHLKKFEEHKLLNKLSNLVTSTLDLDEICRKVFDIVDTLFEPGGFFIAVLEGENKRYLRYLILSDMLNGKRVFEEEDKLFPLSKKHSYKYLKQQETKVTFRSEEEINKLSGKVDPTVVFGDMERLSASIITIPLKTSDEVIGIMSIQSYKFNAFAQSDIVFLETLASHVATAVNNARIFASLKRQLEILDALEDFVIKASALQKYKDLGSLIYEKITRIIPLDSFYFFAFKETGKEFVGEFCVRRGEDVSAQDISGIRFQSRDFGSGDRLTKKDSFGQNRNRAFVKYIADKIGETGKKIALFPLSVCGKPEGIVVLSAGKPVSEMRTFFPFLKTVMEIASLSLSNVKNLEKSFKTLAALGQTEQQLIQSSKMISIGVLAAGLAHEFNNLLVGILSYADFALTKTSVDDLKSSLEIIKISAERARSVANNLLIFARGNPLKKDFADPRKIANNTLMLIKPELKKANINVVFEALKTGKIFVDTNQISQVFFNLILNAIDSMKPNGGELKIKISSIETTDIKTGRQARFSSSAAEYVLFEFSDSGCGIDKDKIRRVFEPFFSTKPTGEGTGLGLSVSYGIIQSHDGVIDVSSKPGAGSTFYVYLPIIPPEKNQPNCKH